MNKNIIIQYADMAEEVKDLRKRIAEAERQIRKIEENGTVRDAVTGGMGGAQHFVVEEVPMFGLERKKQLLNRRKKILLKKENELLHLMNQAEEYINSIDKSELRMIFRFYYIDGMAWIQVAHEMNHRFPKRRVPYNEKNLQKRNERYFKENS